jgi:xanthine dehydrogenase YagT iron-sulfur-binding subunit
MTRRDFVATAFAAAVAFALVPMVETRARAQDGVAAPGIAAPTALSHGIPVTLQINGAAHTLDLDPRVTLLDALREYAGMTGSKKGCDHGQCGACTVHIEGRRVNSCLTLAVAAQGKAITTIEGLANGDTLHPMQASFLKHDGFQCGYCTPGQIMSAVALINEGYAKSRDDVRELMSGNICRCGAYPNIADAVEEIRTGGKPTASTPGERNDTRHVPV